MAYDETLGDRIREGLRGTRNIAEIKMFGGLCFTINGNMACGVMKEDLLVRVPDADFEKLLGQPGTRTFDIMPGRTPKGFIVVDAKVVTTAIKLQKWIDRSVAAARALPPKGKGKRKPKAAKAKR
jgi:TfoX/Sxy family transcriptional regulator of competence genes